MTGACPLAPATSRRILPRTAPSAASGERLMFLASHVGMALVSRAR